MLQAIDLRLICYVGQWRLQIPQTAIPQPVYSCSYTLILMHCTLLRLITLIADLTRCGGDPTVYNGPFRIYTLPRSLPVYIAPLLVRLPFADIAPRWLPDPAFTIYRLLRLPVYRTVTVWTYVFPFPLLLPAVGRYTICWLAVTRLLLDVACIWLISRCCYD